MSNNRTCKVCGTPYYYCPTCPRDADKPAWMTRFDSHACKQLWDILVANGNGEATDAATVQKLNSMNYKSLSINNEGIKAHIARLTGEASKTPESTAPLTKEEIKEAVTAEPKKAPEVKPNQNAQQAVSAAADTMHKNNKFKFLNK